MANFSATQSFSIQGLCQTITSTDTSDYVSNTENITTESVTLKRWTFRDGNGNIIKQFEGNKNDYSCSCSISLLTLNITIELLVIIEGRGGYGVQNTFLIPCLLT